ncbi:hypothetical protein [Streptomyces sp. SHP 1-2]|uniref:hypothetical protein n=1 Tax=Streptomyces sp. SHP 1-2 TaxID=2769489 RepID=UPI0022389D54|nr:hypothetical protein [Streptomyces sp. SHP 1-2]MCW5252203.1 hypothetical protein [Streptomyces sp. SHP 1-2]
MNPLFTSLMRTLVPYAVGLVLAVATRLGLDLDDAAATQYVTAGLAAAYYLLFRGLEWLAERMAWRPLQLAAGLLLGWARPPAYDKTQPVTVPVRMVLDRDHLDRELGAAYRQLGRGPGAGDWE